MQPWPQILHLLFFKVNYGLNFKLGDLLGRHGTTQHFIMFVVGV
jgi:hypothetical protein